MLIDLNAWIDETSGADYLWYVKRLSGNDTLANGSHQAGPYLPKEFLFDLFPSLNRPDKLNPDIWLDLSVDSHTDCRKVRAIWYNNKFHGGTRNETRLTNFGGQSSPLLDPESTGALTVFAFELNSNKEARSCHVWVCRHETEEDLVEERIGPIDPGDWKIWSPSRAVPPVLFSAAGIHKPRASCWLDNDDIPAEWLVHFPSGLQIIKKAIELSPLRSLNPDRRLVKRRDCEFEIFRSVEEAIELPIIKNGFSSIDDFVVRAQTILQRRKARSGHSLELHAKEIFIEEGLREGENFSHAPESEPGKKPDFIFPSADAYKSTAYASDRLIMLAVKTTCKDRWRQILNEADRIRKKHLLTLQEGISENQYREMIQANVQLVVPEPLVHLYPKSVQPGLQTFESFIADVRLCSYK